MNILVTGGAGFIGANFCHFWMGKYPLDNLTVLDKLTYAGHLESILTLFNKENFSFIKGDICDREDVERALSGIDVVVHFAAESHVDRSIISPLDFTITNIVGTHVLLEEARKAKIRHFHHVSTDEVFGSLPLDRPELKFNESTPYNPNTPYAVSKAGSDQLVKTYYRTYGLSTTISNTSNNFGPLQDPEKLIPRFITNLLTGRKIPLMGNGQNVRDWIHCLDHCRAIELIIMSALENQNIKGESFCVGASAERRNIDVTKQILKLLKKDESWIEKVPDRLGHDERYALDSEKIRKLGWKPEYAFEEWLEQTLNWYKENYSWWKPLQEGRPNIDPEIQIGLFHKERS
jgi:dTDP-glucose 4,6-dehydratase